MPITKYVDFNSLGLSVTGVAVIDGQFAIYKEIGIIVITLLYHAYKLFMIRKKDKPDKEG